MSSDLGGEWPVHYLRLQPAQIAVHGGTAFDCYDVKCRLLGVKEASDPEKRKKADRFTRSWFKATGDYMYFLNSRNPLAKDGVCVVWVRGCSARLGDLNTDLVKAGLADTDPNEYGDYTFKVDKKSDPDPYFYWKDELRKANHDYDSGKAPIMFDWLEAGKESARE